MAAVPQRGGGDEGAGIGLVRRALADQWSMVRLFLGDRRLRAPVLAIWVASFGGALHEPVTTFFMVELGATAAQMGKFGVIRTIGAWVLGPVYGWLIDHHTAFIPTLISAFVCALGCTLRGLAPVGRVDLLYVAAAVLGLGAANFWNVVQAHLAYATDSELRHKVISAYFVQVNALQLLGKSAYPLWDAGLKAAGFADDRLLRFRITMSVCSVFCIFGVFNLLVNGQGMKDVKGHSEDKTTTAEASDASEDASLKAKAAKAEQPEKSPARSWGDPATFLAVTGVLVAQSAGDTAVKVLWPLYVSFQFGWKDHAYAWLSLSSSLATIISASALPALAHRVGAGPVATVLCAGAASFVLIGFPAEALAGGHVLGALSFSATSAALKPCLEALASLSMPAHLQGRSFAMVKLAEAFGQTLGNYFGTRLFDTTSSPSVIASMVPLELQGWLPKLGGGSLPFVLVGTSLFVSTSVLAVTLLPRPWERLADAPTAGGEADMPRRTVSDIARQLSGLLRQRVEASRDTHPE